MLSIVRQTGIRLHPAVYKKTETDRCCVCGMFWTGGSLLCATLWQHVIISWQPRCCCCRLPTLRTRKRSLLSSSSSNSDSLLPAPLPSRGLPPLNKNNGNNEYNNNNGKRVLQ